MEKTWSLVPPEPIEQHTYSLTPQLIEESRKTVNRKVFKSVIPSSIIFAFGVLALFIMKVEDNWITGFYCGMILSFVLVMVVSFQNRNRAWRENAIFLLQRTYQCDVYETFIHLRILENEEVTVSQRIPFCEMKNPIRSEHCFLFNYRNSAYVLRLDEIPRNSVLFQKLPSTLVNKEMQLPQRLGTLLFALSLVSILIGTLLIMPYSFDSVEMLSHMWYFFLFLPIPILSVIVGFMLKARGMQWKKNVITGIVVALLLCVWGSFSFIFQNIDFQMPEQEDPQYIRYVEEKIGLDLPEYEDNYTYRYEESTPKVGRSLIYVSSSSYLAQDVAEAFEKTCAEDQRWLQDVPNVLFGIFPQSYGWYEGTYCMLYNLDTQTYNELPEENGTYRFLYIRYDPMEQGLYIVEYDLSYLQ